MRIFWRRVVFALPDILRAEYEALPGFDSKPCCRTRTHGGLDEDQRGVTFTNRCLDNTGVAAAIGQTWRRNADHRQGAIFDLRAAHKSILRGILNHGFVAQAKEPHHRFADVAVSYNGDSHLTTMIIPSALCGSPWYHRLSMISKPQRVRRVFSVV